MHNKLTITISREYGSGGRLVGEQVARALNMDFYDRNLVDLIARQSGLSEEYINEWQERMPSRYVWMPPSRKGHMPVQPYYSNEDKMYFTQSQIIRELAEQKSCVIVGRCADYVLRDHPHCLHVFVHADLAIRVSRAMQYYGLGKQSAERTIRQTDRGRARYYEYYTDQRWGTHTHSNLCVDSGTFGTDGAAEVIANAAHYLMNLLGETEGKKL